jgi:ribosomal 50S subunit-recycling heat shock protein
MLSAAIALSVLSTPLWAQQAPTGGGVIASEPGKAAAMETIKLTAGVAAIDKATRAVTLKTAQGKMLDVVAGPEVKNFDQIKVGDQLVIQYAQALTLEVKKGGGVRESTQNAAVAQAKPGDKPAAAKAREVTIVADVIAVDPKNMTITVKGPKGKVVDLKVNNPDHFKVVKKGDQIEAVYVEAVAISVEPAPKKGATK